MHEHAYYNENDPKTAAWLRELIKEGHIPAGHVDERSILDVKPHELTRYVQQHFFAGIGGWALALRLAGWSDDKPVRTGSCPCQPFSQTGKRLGTKDERHLWPFFRDVITFGEATITFGEQVASPLGREWLAGIRADLEGLGYEVGAADLCAAGVGSPNIRQRLYWMAYTQHGHGRRKQQSGEQGENRRTRLARNSEDNGVGSRPDPEITSDGIVRLADTASGGCRASAGPTIQNHESPPKPTRSDEDRKLQSGPEGHGPTGRLANPDGGQSIDRGIQCSGRHLQQPQNETTGGLVQPKGTGRQQGEQASTPAGHGSSAESAGSIDRLGDADSAGSQGRNERIFQCDYQWPAGTPNLVVCCTDGKARRFEPGSFPLAHGVSGRVGLLRGYGNAIVPQLAAQFIQACEEAINGALT